MAVIPKPRTSTDAGDADVAVVLLYDDGSLWLSLNVEAEVPQWQRVKTPDAAVS